MNDKHETIYRVIMKVEPAVILPRPLIVTISDVDLKITMLKHKEMNIPKGLQISADLSTESIDEAISRVRGYSNRALSLLSFLTFTSHPTILPWKCYDVTPGRKEGLFVQYEYNVPLEATSTRKVDLELLQKSGKIISTLPDSHGKRIMRARHWFNIALQTNDVIDRFVAFWITLESMENVLRRHYNLDVEYTYCSCGLKRTQINNGAMKLFNDIEKNDALYKSMRDLRVNIFHGHETLSVITPKAKEFVPILQRIIDAGLRMILELSDRKSISPVNFADSRPACFVASATVEGSDLSHLDKGQTDIPAIDFDFRIIPKSMDRQGFRYDPRVAIQDGYSFSNYELALYSTEQVGKKVEMESIDNNEVDE